MTKDITPLHELTDEGQHLPDRSDLSQLYERPSQPATSGRVTSDTLDGPSVQQPVFHAALVNIFLVSMYSISYIGLVLLFQMSVRDISDMTPSERIVGFPLSFMILAPLVASVIVMRKLLTYAGMSTSLFVVLYGFFLLPVLDIGLAFPTFSWATLLYLAGVFGISWLYVWLVERLMRAVAAGVKDIRTVLPLVLMVLGLWVLAILL